MRVRISIRNSSTNKGSHCFKALVDLDVANELRLLAQKNSTTLHALMLTVLGHEIRRRTGRSKFLLGTAASTRNSATEAKLVGYYVNMLPLVFHPNDWHPTLHFLQNQVSQNQYL